MSSAPFGLLKQGVFASMQSALLVVDAAGQLVHANERLCRQSGYSHQELIGSRMPFAFWDADEHGLVGRHIQRAMTDRCAEDLGCAVQLRRRDGSAWHGRMHVSPLRDRQGAQGWVATIIDRVACDAFMRQLSDSERRFELLVNHVPEVFYVTDAKSGSLEYVSPSFERIWGQSVDALRRDVGAYIRAVDPTYREEVVAAFQRQRQGEPTQLEYRIRRPDGQERWVWDQSHPIREAGQPLRIVGVAADVTDRKRVELELQRRAERLSEAELIARVGSCEIEVSTGVVDCSVGLCHLVGCDGKHQNPTIRMLLRRLLPQERRQVVKKVRSLMKGSLQAASSMAVQEWSLQAKGIRDLPIALHVRARLTENRRSLLLTVQDISDSLRLQSHSHRLAQTVEQSPDPVMITDANGSIEYVNAAFVSVTGYARDEAVGRTPSFLKAPRSPSTAIDSLKANLAAGVPWRGKLVNRNKDGQERVVLLSVAPIRNSLGVITHFVSSEEDITEKDRMGRELDQYRNQLEALVRQRTDELEKAVQKAAQASQAKSDFLANVSHEIRTPMNAIVGLAHLLLSDEPKPNQVEWLQHLDAAARQLLGVITDVLDLSKIEAGRLTVESSDMALREVLEGACRLLRIQAEEKDLALQVSIDPRLPDVVMGDPLRLNQVLLNLIGNAIKFTDRGHIDVTAERLESDLGSRLRVSVRDTGIGIPPDRQAFVFQPFEQGDASMQRRHGGTGLGLSISRRLVELMEGQIAFESRPGEGSRFWFELPLRESIVGSIAQSTSAVPRAWDAASGGRILLADDNRLNRRVAADVLTRHGYQVTEAVDGEEAVEASTSQDFDLILMDLQMPKVDGIQAAWSIRRLPRHAKTPILAMSGNVFEDDRQRCKDAGMNDFIAKPVRPQALLSALRRWQGGARAAPLASGT